MYIPIIFHNHILLKHINQVQMTQGSFEISIFQTKLYIRKENVNAGALSRLKTVEVSSKSLVLLDKISDNDGGLDLIPMLVERK